MMDLDEAIQHCEEVAISKTKQVENGDWEKGSSTERDCIACASEHQQLAEWLKELKAYKDARTEINQALYDDARGEQNDYERGRKSGIFLCESIISVKLGESRSEIPNTYGDAISRDEAVNAIYDLCGENVSLKENPWRDNPHMDAVVDALENLPSVTPQQRTGRWIDAEVLDKIRAEIEAIEDGISSYHNDRPWIFKDEALAIIDKYKAESGDKDGND